jgi:hypothetical protein
MKLLLDPRFFARSMRTALPAAWSAHARMHFGFANFNSSRARFGLFSFFDPTNPLIARQWRNILPHLKHFFDQPK